METQSPVKLTPDITLSHLISVEPKAAEMLASIGVDPEEHQEETLRSVCKKRQWSETEVLRWITKHRFETNETSEKENKPREPDFGDDVLKWTHYIEEELLVYNVQLLDEISSDFPRVCQIHGNQYPQLKNMKWYFEHFEDALRLYLTFEKRKFFKLIRKWENNRGDILDGTIREMKRCINIMRQDHARLQNYMNTMRDKADEFKSPDGACTTLLILNQNLKMLYSALNKQFRMEKEILLPLVQKKLDAG